MQAFQQGEDKKKPTPRHAKQAPSINCTQCAAAFSIILEVVVLAAVAAAVLRAVLRTVPGAVLRVVLAVILLAVVS